MSKFIDAEKLLELLEQRKTQLSKWVNTDRANERIDEICGIIDSDIESLPKLEELPPVALSKFPTLRQSLEEQMYSQIVRKIPGCPPHAGITVSFTLRPSTVRHLKKDYEQNGIPATAVGKVCTNTDPKLLIVDSDEWQSVLGQFDNGQRVRIILVKEDEE